MTSEAAWGPQAPDESAPPVYRGGRCPRADPQSNSSTRVLASMAGIPSSEASSARIRALKLGGTVLRAAEGSKRGAMLGYKNEAGRDRGRSCCGRAHRLSADDAHSGVCQHWLPHHRHVLHRCQGQLLRLQRDGPGHDGRLRPCHLPCQRTLLQADAFNHEVLKSKPNFESLFTATSWDYSALSAEALALGDALDANEAICTSGVNEWGLQTSSSQPQARRSSM